MVQLPNRRFVGRAAELSTLDEALESAAHGLTTTVLVGGEAGVGKSRLLKAWNEVARAWRAGHRRDMSRPGRE